MNRTGRKQVTGLLAMALSAGLVQAADYEWTAPDMAYWDESQHWTPAGVPAEADNVRVARSAPLFVRGNRTVTDLTIDLPVGFVQLVGSGPSVLTVNGTLLNRRDAKSSTSIRGHIKFEAGTLGLVLNRVKAEGGLLVLGQAHEQTSRALTRLEVRELLEISGAATVELFTDGAVALIRQVNFTDGDGTLVLNNGKGSSRTVRVGSLEGVGLVVAADEKMTGNTTMLELNAPAGKAEFAGSLRDRTSGKGGSTTLSLIKTGQGFQTLSGPCDYSGMTMIREGALIIQGDLSQATGSLTVFPGAVLAGGGTIGGPVTVSGKLLSGASLGSLTFRGGLRMEPTAETIVRTADAGEGFKGGGSLQLGGKLTVDNRGFTPKVGDELKLFSGFTSIQGRFEAIEGKALPGGLQWDDSELTTRGVLIVRRG